MKIEVKELKKKTKKSKKRERNNSSDDSKDSWSVGLGSTGELVHLADVENKFKKLKIKTYNRTNKFTLCSFETEYLGCTLTKKGKVEVDIANHAKVKINFPNMPKSKSKLTLPIIAKVEDDGPITP